MFKNLNEKDKKKIYSLLSLVVVCGIALVAISGLEKKETVKQEENINSISKENIGNEESAQGLEEKLKNILSQIEGAGELDVMITYESSEEIQPAFNTNTTTEETREVDKPKINGVIVVASGAKDPVVKETLYSAVQTALQVQGHQVEIYTK